MLFDDLEHCRLSSRFAASVAMTREDGDDFQDGDGQPQVEDEERPDEFMARKDLLLDSLAHLVYFISGNETRESRATTSRSHDARASASTTAIQGRSSNTNTMSESTQQGGRPVSSPVAIPASPRVQRPSRQTAHMSASVASASATATMAAELPQLSVGTVNMLEHENRQLRRQVRSTKHPSRGHRTAGANQHGTCCL